MPMEAMVENSDMVSPSCYEGGNKRAEGVTARVWCVALLPLPYLYIG
jgi:hypothetical protein